MTFSNIIKKYIFFNIVVCKLLTSLYYNSKLHLNRRIFSKTTTIFSLNNNLIKKDLISNKNGSYYSFSGSEKIISIGDEFFTSTDIDLNDSKSSWHWWESRRKSENLLKNAIASSEVTKLFIILIYYYHNLFTLI